MNIDSKTRVQFDMRDSKLERLEQLMEEAGIETRKDFFNNALSMFEWAIEEVKKGHVVATVDPDTGKYSKLVMPILSGLRRTTSQPRPEPTENPAVNKDTAQQQGASRLIAGVQPHPA